MLAAAHNVRFDMTPTKQFVLSDASKQVAERLREEVHVTVFYSTQETGRRREMADLLDQFHAASRLLTYRFVDLDRAPGLAKKYRISSYNSGVIESGGRVLPLRDINEQEITTALLKLSREKTRTVCFLTGHGERSPESADQRTGYSAVAKSLQHEGFAIRTLGTVPMEGIPAACSITILAGPSHELLPGEADLLAAHVRAGGKLMVLLDPSAPQSFTVFMRRFGVDVGDDLVVDERNRFFGADSFTPQVPIFDKAYFGDQLDAAAVFPLTRSLRADEKSPPEGMRVSVLAMTSPESWALVGAEKNPDSQDVHFREGVDQRGPVPVGVLVSLESAGSESKTPPAGRIASFGDSDFASNFYLNLLGNKDLFLSTVAILGEEPELVAVRHKGLMHGTLSPISLTARQGRTVFWVAVVALPTLFIAAGLLTGLARRRRRGGR